MDATGNCCECRSREKPSAQNVEIKMLIDNEGMDGGIMLSGAGEGLQASLIFLFSERKPFF